MKRLSSGFYSLYSAPLIKAAAFLTCLVLSQPAFAQDIAALSKMTSVAEKIRDAFTGKLVRAILVIAFCGSAVMYAVNKDNDRVKKNCVAVGIASALIMGASGLVDFFMSEG